MTGARRKLRPLSVAMSAVLLVALGWAVIFVWTVHARYANRIYRNAHETPVSGRRRVAVVFGAGLWRLHKPSPILFDRVATAADLYHLGIADKLLMSGDNRFVNYNEPLVMRETAISLGVPPEAITLDYGGRRTYDTCYRAREVFGVRRAVLVTQGFHITRAMYLCDSLGIDSIGVKADRQPYGSASRLWWNIRDAVALVGAWLDLHILRPTPLPGERIQIQGLAFPSTLVSR